MPRYYCDYCDTYLTHDSVSLSLSLKLFGAFGLYVCLFKDYVNIEPNHANAMTPHMFGIVC